MANKADLLPYWQAQLVEAEKELVGFEKAIVEYGLRVRERDVHGERDVTESRRQELKDTVEEYKTMIRDWSSG